MTATRSYDPRTGIAVDAPPESTPEQVDAALAAAAQAAADLAATEPGVRGGWLRAIADALDGDNERLAILADEETALGMPRLTGELGRAAAALRFYAAVAEEGSWLGATIDHATDARPDLRRMNIALGPIAVFGASNFPFGFGTVGHDMATALAAGCPAVVKAHPAHPRLSDALARIALAQLESAGAPAGTFAIVGGLDAGRKLVVDPRTAAVAFTGSQAGGLALWRLSQERPEPIPVFAEMGTVNAAVVTRRAAQHRAGEIAEGFVASATLGMGQFCTKPGLLLVPAGSGIAEHAALALHAAPQDRMLTAAISDAFATGVDSLVRDGATVLAQQPKDDVGWTGAPTLLRVPIESLTAGSRWLTECFGPVAIVAEYADDAELDAVLAALPGALAAAVHGAGDDDPDLAPLVARLTRSVGRIVVDAWPTGVAVTWAQQHGGPWPATTIPAATSVGAAGIARFVRPISYQSVPAAALPEPLRDANPWRLPRRVDGVPGR